MLTLHLQGRQAYLPPTTTIKLTRCNPYFENQGDYTLELQLPLQGCPQNQAIFGPLHRPEQPHAPQLSRHIPMQLIAPPIHLTGYALITAITPTQVKIQLVAGRSALNHAIEDDATYIDRLDLGHLWDQYAAYQFTPGPNLTSGAPIYHTAQTIEEQKQVLRHCAYGFGPTDPTTGEAPRITPTILLQGHPTQTDTIAVPILSTTDTDTTTPDTISGIIANANLLPPHTLGHRDATTTASSDLFDRYTYLAPQPYLISVIRHILTAAGYPNPNLQYLEDSPLISHLIILNPRQTIERAHTLPHWTLSTFLSELQNLLAIVFTVTDDGRVHAIPRSQYYTRTRPLQPLATDHPTRQSELDQATDAQNLTTTAGSVDYDYTTDPSNILHLPDEVFERAQILPLPNLSAIQAHFSALTPEERAASTPLYIATDTHRHYAILHHPAAQTWQDPTYHLHEVDQLSPRLQDPTDPTIRTISTQLNIIPAPIETLPYIPLGTQAPATDIQYDYPIPAVPLPITEQAAYSIDLAINPDTDDDTTTTNTNTTTDTHLYIAYYNPDQTIYTQPDGRDTLHPTYRSPLPITIPYTPDPTLGGIPTPIPAIANTYPAYPAGPFQLSQSADATPATIANLLANQPTIDTRLEHHIPIQLPNGHTPDPTLPYLICGRLYACHRLEITLTPTGPNPLIQGHFYEIQQP